MSFFVLWILSSSVRSSSVVGMRSEEFWAKKISASCLVRLREREERRVTVGCGSQERYFLEEEEGGGDNATPIECPG